MANTIQFKRKSSGVPGNSGHAAGEPLYNTGDSRLWIARNNGVTKTKSEAQALVTAVMDQAQSDWDDLPEAEKAPAVAERPRPPQVTLP